MFASFFPRPKLFFLSAVGWFFVALAAWHLGGSMLHETLNFSESISWFEAPVLEEGEEAPFMTPEKLWNYAYIVLSAFVFCVIWFFIDRNKWYRWSVVGSAVILVSTYFSVQISVWLNDWYGEFYNLIQQGLGEPGAITVGEYYGMMATAAYVIFPYVIFLVFFAFYNAHYVFRWRTAMNEYYMDHWGKLRHVEGAAQRVQEDTMRFADIVENLGSAFVRSIMTLIAFLPLLWTLSDEITELPILGQVEGSFVFIALISAAFGTVLLALVGIRLPGLQFKNQKVEAAYRKELVYGEDHEDRAEPKTVKDLYGDVRKNYYRIYAEYTYFNFFRYLYNNVASFVPLIALGPTIAAGAITLGLFTQITQAFSQVENSFQFLVNSWTTIIELISIRKRLVIFEQAIDGNTDLDPSQIEGMTGQTSAS